MHKNEHIGANRAIHILALREGVTPDVIREAIRDAIQEAQKNSAPRSEMLQSWIAEHGNRLSPEEVIAEIAYHIMCERDCRRA